MSQSRERKRKFDIPIWCKANLSIEEAAAYHYFYAIIDMEVAIWLVDTRCEAKKKS